MRGELRRVAAADVLHRVDRFGREVAIRHGDGRSGERCGEHRLP